MTRSVFSAFTYDAHGNLTGYTANYGTNHPLNGVYSFDYDEKDQLISETSTRQGAPTYEYAYDAAGNPTEFRSVAFDEVNEDNQDPNHVYDGNGNPTTYNGQTLTYDSQNHLLAKDGVTFGYDVDGRRAWKQVGDVRTYFLYEGNNPVCEVQLIDGHTVVTALNVFSNGELVSRTAYTYDESGTQIGAETTFYQFDALGNVGHRLDEDGNLLTTQLFDAYGLELAAYDDQENLLQPGAIPDPYGYKGSVGYYTDHETGLILCTARYYDAEVGRWLTRDPIGYDGGLNLYQYCSNNPVCLSDPDGNVPVLGVVILAVAFMALCPDPANAPGPGDSTIPSMSEIEKMVEFLDFGLKWELGGRAVGSILGIAWQGIKPALGRVISRIPVAVVDVVRVLIILIRFIQRHTAELRRVARIVICVLVRGRPLAGRRFADELVLLVVS